MACKVLNIIERQEQKQEEQTRSNDPYTFIGILCLLYITLSSDAIECTRNDPGLRDASSSSREINSF